ncbi:obscurin-like protein 1 isoform X1 [Scleropages formosus]|uniref:obscurin-like protein 1 isoform X1 n=2 Tax=Scleropages formosus TaxID=113540 RepID=UPI0010FAC0F0|nr:obscurin-like protein 1 isoform X1 [Scleropages formosus]
MYAGTLTAFPATYSGETTAVEVKRSQKMKLGSRYSEASTVTEKQAEAAAMDVFKGAPRIRAYPRPVVVCSGADATLTCRISGNPRPEVVWERNGKRIPSGGHCRPHEEGDVYSLTILATTLDDAGQYVCKVKNSVGEAYAAATLKVEETEERVSMRENGKSDLKVEKQMGERKERASFIDGGVGDLKMEKKTEDGEERVSPRQNGESKTKVERKVEEREERISLQNNGLPTDKVEYKEQNKGVSKDNGDTSLKLERKQNEAGLPRKNGDITNEMEGEDEKMEDRRSSLDYKQTLKVEDKKEEGRFSRDNIPINVKVENNVEEGCSPTDKGETSLKVEDKQQERRISTSNMYSNWTLEGKVVEGPGDTLKVNGIEGGLPGVCNGDQTLKVEDEGGQRGSPEDNAPHVLIRPLSTRVHLSDDVTLSCKLWGQPLPEVTWEKDGRQLSEIFESAHFSMGYQDGGWFQLSIFGTRAPDAGVYTCRAKNEFGEALAGAVLLVDKPSLEEEYARNGYPRDRESHQSRRGRHHGPQLREDLLPSPNKVKNFAVTEGKHAKFRCFVTGKPKPDIVWSKDGHPIVAGRRHLLYEDREGYFTLKVLYCKQQDNGTYVCSASNMAGHTLSAVHLSVKEPRMRFRQSLRDVEVREKGLAVLECEVPEESVPTTWYLEDHRLQEGPKYGMEEWGRRRRLTIRDVGMDDDGIYLCEMADGGRSIAEVAVKGTIVRKLPRKLEVLEGENAAFFVEVEEDEMEVKWYKDGLQLWDTHQTIIKSFGKTHILVFVNTVPQDSGVVTFTVGRSKTTSKLKVKAARHAPPSCPAGAWISSDRTNTVLLSWGPVQDVGKGPPTGYVVERQEVGSHEWVQCLTTEGATSAELPGDNVPREAEYRFRVCSVNKYGRSGHVEFPGSVHLTPIVKIQTHLEDAVVHRGQDASFTVELTASVSGTWFWNGTKIEDDSRFSTHHSDTQHLLHIQKVQVHEHGAEITFTASGVRDSALLRIRAPVKFTPLAEMDSNKQVEPGNPVVLYCELSDPAVPVRWYKDGLELQSTDGLLIQSEGNMRRIVIESAESSHSGVYSCDAVDDVIKFNVEVKAPLPRFVGAPEMEKSTPVVQGGPIVLQCELTDPSDHVCWYKDGEELFPQRGIDIQSEGATRRLMIPSANLSDAGVYSCTVAGEAIHFNVNVQAPPVKFKEVTPEDVHKRIVELDPLVLECEVSRPDAEVRWYKDGNEKHQGDEVKIQSSGTLRRLIIQSAQLSDSGTYVCRSGDSEAFFTVTIREPPVMIVHPKEDVPLDHHISEEVILSCELSRSSGLVHWYKDGQKLQEGDKVVMKSEGPYRRLVIPCSTMEDSGEYVCDTGDDSAFFQLSITEAPVHIVSPSQCRVELVHQVSESVVLSCELSKAEAEVHWYCNGLHVENTESLLLEVDGAHRRLVIPGATFRDSGEYVCKTTGDSVTFLLSITEPPAKFVGCGEKPGPMQSIAGEPVVLRCEVSRPDAQVCWRKDGMEIKPNAKVCITEDGVFRQLTILSATMKDSGQYICGTKDDFMSFQVKIAEPPVKILRKAELNTELTSLVSDDFVLECELSRANGSIKWFKDGKRIIENERFCYEEEGPFRSLVILSAELTDSGEYLCDAGDDTVAFTVVVKEPPVSILGKSCTQEPHSLEVGGDLILACEVSRPNAPVQWYCNERLLSSDSRTSIESYGTVRKLILSELQPSDSGKYTCDAVDDKMVTVVKVQEPPVQFLNKDKANVAIGYENESVTLTAQVSRDNATVQWMRDWTLLSGDRFHMSSEGSVRLLTIDPLQRSDSGEYSCHTDADQMNFSLLVREMRVRFTQPLQDTVGHCNGLLTLRCELNKARGDMLWSKDGQEIVPSRRFAIRANGTERSLTIHRLTAEDAGEYACESKDDRSCATVMVEMPRVVEFLAELHNTTVLEGEDATFKCVVSPEDVLLMWYRDGEPVTVGDERVTVSRNGLCHTLHIHRCQLSDSGRVTAEAEGLVSKASLQVQEAQVLFTKKMEPVAAEEYADATLEVEVNLESAEVQWMRQGVVIQSGPKYTVGSSGQRRSLTIHSLGISDRGTYCCETLHDRTQGKLIVEPRKISICKELRDIETFEYEAASFEVELSHANVEGVWQKDGLRLKSGHQARLSTKGRLHSLTLSSITLEDAGTIVFSAEGARTSARLTVKEPPVTFLRKPEDLCFPEGALVSIECELSRQNADVKWLKNDAELKPCKSYRIYSTGRKRFLQILKCEVSDSGIYTCDAGDTKASCCLEVYERVVEIVQPLEDLDIQEDQNAVFMCEVSRGDVQGQWFWNEERIRPTSTVKIRQEGTKHFLLMCNVKPEDSGEIKFIAREAESIAYLEVEELPATIVKPLRDRTALENHRVILECTVSTPRCDVRWFRGDNEISPSQRFEICSEGCYHKLVIHQLRLEDEGSYSVCVGEHTSSARLMVEAQALLMVREIEDVEVTAPEEARFECQVSVPAAREPVWSLNGETLQSGPRVHLETLGTVYRLTLRSTTVDMRGEVKFTVGKAKSIAKLTVKSE